MQSSGRQVRGTGRKWAGNLPADPQNAQTTQIRNSVRSVVLTVKQRFRINLKTVKLASVIAGAAA